MASLNLLTLQDYAFPFSRFLLSKSLTSMSVCPVELQQMLSAWWECCWLVEGMLLEVAGPVPIGFAIAPVRPEKSIASVDWLGQVKARAAA